MAITGDKEVINYLGKLRKTVENIGQMRSLGPAHKAVMEYYGNAVIPMISLDDGGKSRGIFVGVLRKMGIRVLDVLWRDKSLLSGTIGDINATAFNDGVREGLQTSINGLITKVNIKMTRVNWQKAVLRLRDKKILTTEVNKMIQLGVKVA